MLLLSTSQEKNNLYSFLIASILLLNLADAVFSLYYISYLKVLEEANPVWATLIHTHPTLFFILKILIVGIGCFFLNRYKENTSSKVGVVLCFFSYFFIVLWFVQYSIL